MKTYGTVSFGKKNWTINAEPHVLMRLRRIFARSSAKSGPIVMKHTEEVCRDIQWALERYPLEISDSDRLKLTSSAQAYEERNEYFAKVVASGTERKFELAVPAREYQKVAADLALKMGGLLLNDDLGLGKSCSAICTLTEPTTLPALVVCMTHLAEQWKKEINRFAPNLTVHIGRKTTPDAPKGKHFDVYILTYSKIAGWADLLSGSINSVIFDEIQELRRTGTAKYTAASMLAKDCRYKQGLSVGPESRIELIGGPFNLGFIGGIEEAFNIISDFMKSSNYILDVSSFNIKSRGWTGNCFSWKKVNKFIKHKNTAKCFNITTSGRSVLTLTEDHSIFIPTENSFEINEIVTSSLEVGNILISDNGKDWEIQQEVSLNVLELMKNFSKAKVLVDLKPEHRKYLKYTSKTALSIAWYSYTRRGTFGSYLPLSLYYKSKEDLPKPTHLYFSQTKKSYKCDPTINLSSWAYILGFFLGDGWLEANRVSFAVEDVRIEEFVAILKKLPFIELEPSVFRRKGKSAEVRCSNTIFAEILRHIFGEVSCYTKFIPSYFITTWSYEARKELFMGIVDSDGHLNNRANGKRYYIATTSKKLADDILTLLKSLSVLGSLSISKPRLGGIIDGRQIQGRELSYIINCSHYAYIKDNTGHRGHISRLNWSKDIFNEVPVRKILNTETPPQYVYDLEMEGHPSFTANGILVHNSATPIFNYGIEFYNVINILKPDMLGTKSEFLHEWCTGYYHEDKARISDPKAFGTYVREQGIMLRRTRKDVGRELPALTQIEHFIECDEKALEAVQNSVTELAKFILSKQGNRLDRMQAGGRLDQQMRQATGISKASYAAEFIKMLASSGEKIVVYSYHHAVHDILADRLKEFKPVKYTGEESPKQKEESKKAFCEGDSQILLMSINAGAGLDGLQFVSSIAVVVELSWSYGQIAQGLGRLHRDGQKSPVMAYFLLSDQGSDPIMLDVLGIKRGQLEFVIDPDITDIEEIAPVKDINKLAESILKQHGMEIPKPIEED